LAKISRQKNFIPKLNELEHSAAVEIFPFLVEKFPLRRNFVFGFWTLAFAKFEPKYAKWKFFHFGGNFSTSKKIFFFAELQELEHSAEGTFFRKIGNFSTFSTNSKIPKIYLSGPISVQSFSKKYFLKKSDIQAVGF